MKLISDAYRNEQRRMHENSDYGVASVAYAPIVADVIQRLGTRELLDYGAGKGRLGQMLRGLITVPLTVHHYDPAILQWSRTPEPCELVACIDVLEHIEPELIYNVLDDLKRVTLSHAVMAVHTGAAVKLLADGRNAHLIQRPAYWWMAKIMRRFELVVFNRMPQGFWVLVERNNHELDGLA